MKKYKVRINCPCFKDFIVKAKNKEEAKEKAITHFECPGGDAEFCEFLPVDNLFDEEID
jgi:hypothetical protein